MKEEPTFSVVVAAHNRPERIARCVAAVAAQDFPQDRLEMVVVDDGSAEPLEPHIRAAAEGTGLQVRVIRQPNAGPATARNRGAAAARLRYLVFTDDDCVPAPDWLAAFAHCLEGRPDTMLGGRFANAEPENLAAVAAHTITDLTYDMAQADGRGTGPGEAWMFVTANLLVPARLFHEVGGFDESFPLAAGEDFDFCHHYQHAGHPAGYCPAAVIHHHHPMTLRQFWRQQFGYGRGMLQFRRRATARMGRVADRNIGPFQLRLAARLLARLRGPRSFLNAGYVALSQVAIIGGALAEVRRVHGEEVRAGTESQS